MASVTLVSQPGGANICKSSEGHVIVCSPLPPVKLGSGLHNNKFLLSRDNNNLLLDSLN